MNWKNSGPKPPKSAPLNHHRHSGVLQSKMAASAQPGNRSKPTVVQTKQAHRQPVAPPVFRPQAKQTVQPKTAPRAYKVIQRALAGAGGGAPPPGGPPPPPGPPSWAARLAAQQTPAQRAASIAAAQAAQQQMVAAQQAAAAQAAAAAAAAAAAELLRQRQAAAPLRNVDLRDSAGNHYADGWGAAYGITSAAALRARVRAEWNADEGHDGSQCSIDLGTRTVGGQTRGCTVFYRKVWRNAQTVWDADVWHCGPSLAAG
jgi:hypothetical protein